MTVRRRGCEGGHHIPPKGDAREGDDLAGGTADETPQTPTVYHEAPQGAGNTLPRLGLGPDDGVHVGQAARGDHADDPPLGL